VALGWLRETTTLLTLAGELPKIAGEVQYMERPFKGPLHQRVRRGLAFVPEERFVFMGLSVADNLKIGGHSARVLAMFPELGPLLGRRAGLLSGGEQQMLTLGRALAMKPKMLMVDELSVGPGASHRRPAVRRPHCHRARGRHAGPAR
jgi:branched-chain amino acid transport system ATP-binding protein